MARMVQQQLRNLKIWSMVGIGIKRWVLVLMIAASLLGAGIVYAITLVYHQQWLPEPVWAVLSLRFLGHPWLRVALAVAVGGGLLLLVLSRLGQLLVAPFRLPDQDVAQMLYHHQQTGRGPRIVAIGGGTGMPGLLRGLTAHTRNLTAIVTVADDGGSSGRLRKQFGMIPPGDFRNTIAALARDEALMTQLMQYRFGAGEMSSPAEGEDGLRGHAFGNLVLTALTGITGSFDGALDAIGRVLAMNGRVMPSTLDDVRLSAEIRLPTGRLVQVQGESRIPQAGGRIERLMLEPDDARVWPPALQAILEADLIVMGPGSLYTSLLPNLLVRGLMQAIGQSRARRVYVCNVATQPGETDGYNSADHVEAILRHTCPACLDLVLANDNLSVSAENTCFVPPVPHPAVTMVTADLIDTGRPWRHDSRKVAAALMRLLA